MTDVRASMGVIACMTLLALLGCSRTQPSDTICVLEPSLTPDGVEAVLEGADRWTTATQGEFQCARVEYGVRPEAAEGTIAFRMAELPPEDDGRPRYGFTWRVHGIIRATVTLAPGQDVESLSSTATHEIGHALGLNHVYDTTASVMFPDHAKHAPTPMPRDVVTFRSLWH